MPKKKPSKTEQNEALEELTPKQNLALDGLLSGDRFEAAAGKAGVNRNTVARWLKEDPVFIARFRNRRSEIESSLDNEIRELAGEALQVLREELESNEPRVRLAAAREILRQRSQGTTVEVEQVSATDLAIEMKEQEDHRNLWGGLALMGQTEAIGAAVSGLRRSQGLE